jgi:hypothetical protein
MYIYSIAMNCCMEYMLCIDCMNCYAYDYYEAEQGADDTEHTDINEDENAGKSIGSTPRPPARSDIHNRLNKISRIFSFSFLIHNYYIALLWIA